MTDRMTPFKKKKNNFGNKNNHTIGLSDYYYRSLVSM